MACPRRASCRGRSSSSAALTYAPTLSRCGASARRNRGGATRRDFGRLPSTVSSVSHRGKDGDGRSSRWAESDHADGPTGLRASRGDVDDVRSIKQSGLSERGRRGERALDCFARAARVSFAPQASRWTHTCARLPQSMYHRARERTHVHMWRVFSFFICRAASLFGLAEEVQQRGWRAHAPKHAKRACARQRACARARASKDTVIVRRPVCSGLQGSRQEGGALVPAARARHGLPPYLRLRLPP